MASLQSSLVRALQDLAHGSPNDPTTVETALYPLSIAIERFFAAVPSDQQLAALLPSVRDLLQVAGWLLPCMGPSSSLPAWLLHNAQQTFKACMSIAIKILTKTSAMDCAAFQQWLEPRSRPNIPGEPNFSRG